MQRHVYCNSSKHPALSRLSTNTRTLAHLILYLHFRFPLGCIQCIIFLYNITSVKIRLLLCLQYRRSTQHYFSRLRFVLLHRNNQTWKLEIKAPGQMHIVYLLNPKICPLQVLLHVPHGRLQHVPPSANPASALPLVSLQSISVPHPFLLTSLFRTV